MNFYYTAEFNSFISEKYKTDGTYTDKSWPDDAVLCTAEEVNIFRGTTPPAGMKLGSVAGRPAWVDVPPLTRAEMIAIAENERQRLIVNADAIMLDWRTELMLGEISDANRAKLSAWLAYKNKVKSIPAEEAITAEFSWPDQPA